MGHWWYLFRGTSLYEMRLSECIRPHRSYEIMYICTLANPIPTQVFVFDEAEGTHGALQACDEDQVDQELAVRQRARTYFQSY